LGWSNAPAAPNFCGTNTATFVVARTGATNATLAVAYEVLGSATNGADYVALSGHVTIAAGSRVAEINVIPIDDSISEPTETIRLALRPAVSGAPPAYMIGKPAHAGAILVDNDQPRPNSGTLSDRSFHLMQPGANGAWFRIETSTNLVSWTTLTTNLVTDGALHFVDPETTELPRRFYRAVPLPHE
jgi:hypothetical protein